MEAALHAEVENPPARLEPLPSSPRPARRWAAAGFPLAVLVVLLLAATLVYLFFVRPDAFSEWFAFKPGILVEMTAESGKLQFEPFDEISEIPSHWYEEAVNFHSFRWAATLLFLGLHYVTGLEMRVLSVAPFGIVLCLLALLFFFLSAERGSAGRWGFLLSALLLLFNWPMLIWVFHSGGWPGATMVLLSVGLLLQAYGRQRHQVWFRAMALIFMLLAFGYYHAMAVLLTFLLPTLFAYKAAVSLASRWKSKLAPAPALSYSSLAAITVAWFFLDPLTGFFLGSGITRPMEGVVSFYASIFERGGDVVPYQVGYSPIGRIMLMLPLVAISLTGGWVWLRSQPITLLMRRPLSEQEVIAGALYIAAPALLVAGIISGAGGFRYPEAYFLMLMGTPLLLFQHVFRAGSVTRLRLLEGTLLAAGLLIVTASSFVVLSQEPISRWAFLDRSDESTAQWAAKNINEPYFADNFFTGLILLENPHADIVSLEGDVKTIGETFYGGRDRLAGELRDRGAELAVLSRKTIADESPAKSFRALKTTDFFIGPIPDYDFDVAPYGRVYDDGRNRVITLGAQARGP